MRPLQPNNPTLVVLLSVCAVQLGMLLRTADVKRWRCDDVSRHGLKACAGSQHSSMAVLGTSDLMSRHGWQILPCTDVLIRLCGHRR